MSITKWWFNLNWSHLLWRRVKLPQKEASAYYLREEFLPQAVRPFCRQSWTLFIPCVIQLFFKRKRQSTRDPKCKNRKQSDLLEENPSDDNNRTWRDFMNHISSSIKSIIIGFIDRNSLNVIKTINNTSNLIRIAIIFLSKNSLTCMIWE